MEFLDQIDLQILRALQKNARLTIKELAAHVNLSSTPVFERLKRLENKGYIKKYIALIDAEKLNMNLIVFCNIKLRRINKALTTDFIKIIKGVPQVTECYNISGKYDFLLKIHATDIKHYQDFVLNVLGVIENLNSLESIFVIEEIKHEYGINIE